METKFSVDEEHFQVARLETSIEVWEDDWANYLFCLPGDWTDDQIQSVLTVYCKAFAQGKRKGQLMSRVKAAKVVGL